jgi:aquaporin Z
LRQRGFFGAASDAGHLAVALAFGLSIVAAAYVIGNISGCHINPAVSFSMLLNKKLSLNGFLGYAAAQVAGAFAAVAILKYLSLAYGVDHTGSLGSNGFGSGSALPTFVVESVLTFIFTILGVTSDDKKGSVAGIVIGLTLTFVHIAGIPLTGTSVNPARSIAPAVFAGGAPLAQLWVFITAPFVGAALTFKYVRKN